MPISTVRKYSPAMTGESINVSSVTGANWTVPDAFRVVVSVLNAVPNFQFFGSFSDGENSMVSGAGFFG